MGAEPTLRQVVVFLDHLSAILEATTALNTHFSTIGALSKSLELRVHQVSIVDRRILELISYLSIRGLDIYLIWVSKGHVAGCNRRIDIDIADALDSLLNVRLIVILKGLAILTDDFRLIHDLRLVHLGRESMLTYHGRHVLEGRHARLLTYVLVTRKLRLSYNGRSSALFRKLCILCLKHLKTI